MPQRPKPVRQRRDESPPPTPSERRYSVTRYGKTRNFAAYEGQNIIAVTLYRKGAEEITTRLDEKDRRIAELESQLATGVEPPVSPSLPSPEPEPVSTWSPPRQLDLLTAPTLL